MEIHVKENAINSLEVGLVFYNKFLNNLDYETSTAHFGNLKFSVIAIHNSIELLTKAILLDINEFLVFKSEVETDDLLCGLLRYQYNNKKTKANIAYHAVFSQNHYKTIEYGKCITLLQKIFKDEISKSNYETLGYLSEYRNTLTHLGYASTFEWYKILVVINNSLELMLGFYIKNLIKSEEYFTKRIINKIAKTIEKSKGYIEDIWMASNENILGNISSKIEIYLDNNLVKINSTEENSEYGLDEDKIYEEINFTYNHKGIEINIIWQFIYSYLNNAIIIISDKGMIVGYVSIDDWNLIFSCDKNGIPLELEEVDILVPREKLYFEIEKIYNISDKTKYTRLEIKSEKLIILMNIYLKKLE